STRGESSPGQVPAPIARQGSRTCRARCAVPRLRRAGSAGSAEPGQRGATLAVHSTLGYAGGFLGPLALRATLRLFGGASVRGWGLAFAQVTVALLLGALVFMWLRPADLAGDRSVTAATASATLHRT